MKYFLKLKISILISFLIGFSFKLSAQNLPNEQLSGIKIPTNFKIDGKNIEWKNGLSAFNKNTQLSYTIANTTDKLYFIFEIKDEDVIDKLIEGGLTVNLTNDENRGKPSSLTYPVISPSDASEMVKALKFKKVMSAAHNLSSFQKDSLIIALNQQFEQQANLARVQGFTGIEDGPLSIYNKAGIKIKGLFNPEGILTLEILLPLKNVIINTSNEFGYNIRLNGIPNPSSHSRIMSVTGGFGTPPPAGLRTYSNGLFSATDFYAKYIPFKN